MRGLERKALAKLKWLVVRDMVEIETASFWLDSPEVKRGELKPEEIETEVFLFPAAGTQKKKELHQHAAAAAISRKSGRTSRRCAQRNAGSSITWGGG